MLRPPQSLLAALAATTAVVTTALCWAGWRLLDQQRSIDAQQAREQLEVNADAAASRISGRLAEAGEWLSGWLSTPASPPAALPGAVMLTIGERDPTVVPAGGLPYVPAVQPGAARAGALDAVERIEFTTAHLHEAAKQYRRLTMHPDPRIQAGAWLRLGRVLRRAGDLDGALRAYGRLSALGSLAVDDLPADLAALLGERAVHLARRERDAAHRAAARIAQGLDGGRWLVARAQAELYRDEMSAATRPPSWRLAESLSDVWRSAGGRLPQKGHRVFAGDENGSVLVMWRSNGRRAALLAAFAESFLPAPGAVPWLLSDAEGQRVAGEGIARARPVARVLAQPEYPWLLQLWPPPAASNGAGRHTLLVTMTSAMVLFVWAASYFIARAVRREAEVGRLQSGFVAAVSHEFRSPLTAVRQMADMLDQARVLSEERRHTYYRAIAEEAERLQRLVETLLAFGRIEAGAARYQLTDVDVGSVVRTAASELAGVAGAAGVRIELCGPERGPFVRADAQALCVAVRNLLDNAVKYSQGATPVSVDWGTRQRRAAIAVTDRGPGIPRREQRAIFGRFVRGRAAVDQNVPGTGLGLAMVQEIVRAHHGRISVESDPGRGSTFTIRLPAIRNGAEG